MVPGERFTVHSQLGQQWVGSSDLQLLGQWSTPHFTLPKAEIGGILTMDSH